MDVYYLIIKTKEDTLDLVIAQGRKGYKRHFKILPNYCLYNSKDTPENSDGLTFEFSAEIPKNHFHFGFVQLA